MAASRLVESPKVRAQETKVVKPGLAGSDARRRDAVRDRIVRVVTVCQEGLKGDSLINDTFERLDQAASFKPDIACLPEDFTRGKPEAVTGPTIERVGKWARAQSCYVISPLRVRAGGRVYNSAVLIDRQGKVAGRYDKIHPTEDELQRGICPGETDPPLFETDFGTIGIQICFDVNWREGWARLKQKGARIIFWPSAYAAAHQMPALAFLNQCFVVTSTVKSASRIYDITGDLLDASAKDRPWASAVLPLGKRLFETDFNAPKMRQVEKKYGSKVQVTWLRDDDWITLASLDPELAVEDIMKEFDLTPLDDYILRAQKAQAKQRPEK
ncbi:MAG: carbon-nitrogen hydrolase family protein [Pedosphaera sp.]|nr:carbon-nitrogen hydrolase family protein [Pedosphaera sp.]